MKELLPYLPQPSRYLGNEINSVHKKPENINIRIALAFPDVYDVGMAYVGQKILYHCLNRKEDFWAERVFAPTLEVAGILRERNTTLCSLESDHPVSSFDLVAFSITHELCYTNVLYMLDLAHIPLESRERDARYPLVAAGGGAVFNAEPLADFVDFMVVGDGEESLPSIAELLEESKRLGISRSGFLREIVSIPGVYVPGFFPEKSSGSFFERQAVEKAVVNDIAHIPFPEKQIVPYGRPVHDRLSVEVARGCTRGCRFCHAGMTYRPVRERTPEQILSHIEGGLNQTGFEEISFLSLSTGDYSRLFELFSEVYTRCASEQVSLALPSVRAGSVSEEMMRLMASIRQTGITLAPEAGTQRLRNVINKGIGEDDLLQHVQGLFRWGWKSVKLYFMIGLPTEEQADLDGILELCRKVRGCAPEENAGRIRITASISPFVPKTHTPFQWERQLGLEEMKERISYLQKICRPYKWLNLKWQLPEMSVLEGLFSRGGRELAPVIKQAFQNSLFFTSWSDHLAFDSWMAVLENNDVQINEYLQSRDLNQALPGDHLNAGVTRKFLQAERAKAYKGVPTEDCRSGKCGGCGVCNHKEGQSTLRGQSKSGEIRPVVHDAGKRANWEAADTIKKGTDAVQPGHKEVHLRLWYSKTGMSRWLSQLEMQRLWERAMRRAKLPLTFSRGYHPMPLMSFSRALPVGVQSRCEWLDIFFRRQVGAQEITSGINHDLPSGLKVTWVQELDLSKRQAQPVAEKYRIDFRPGHGLDIDARWEHFRTSSSFLVQKKGKKKTRNVDLCPLVLDSAFEGSGLELVFDWRHDYMSPLFVLQGIFGAFGLDQADVIKLKQYFEV